ncbi:MAG: phage minor head protein [Planctomycetota bacterium]
MLEAEAALLLLLLRRTRRASRAGTAEDVEGRLRRTLFDVYLSGRFLSASAAFDRTAREFELLQPGLSGRLRRLGAPTVYDVSRANRAAGGYVKHWGRKLDIFTADGARNPIGLAHKSQVWRLELGAATEAADSFNAERERLLPLAPRDAYLKVWDAVLDKRTCPVCERSHGIAVPLDEPFPAGRPGSVHPRCRCVEQIVPASWVDPWMIVA